MKNFILCLLIIVCFQQGYSQISPTSVITGNLVSTSRPLTSIKSVQNVLKKGGREFGEGDVANKRVKFDAKNPTANSVDGALQKTISATATVPLAPSLTFQGASQVDNNALYGGGVLPPDEVLCVGPNHVVQMINLVHKVFDKSGNLLTGPLKFSDIAPSAGDDGDPIALYDQAADRWILLQFSLPANGESLIFCVSKTNDPTGEYYVYQFFTPGVFPDYPHVGIWNDSFVITTHEFNQAGTAYLGQGFYTVDRKKMLDGVATTTLVRFQVSTDGGYLPVSFEGMKTPEPSSLPTFFSYDADEFGGGLVDRLVYRTLTPNYVTPASSTLSAPTFLNTSPFDGRSPNTRSAIEQPSTAVGLDAIADRMMSRIIYRRFDDYESIVMNYVVNVSGVSPTTKATFQAAMRWYELTRPNSSSAWTINQQSTYAPDPASGTGNNRWMGCPGIDQRGNVALAYSLSGTVISPGIYYAERKKSDALSTLGTEQVFFAGSGSQTSTSSRWGDYSAMTTDPTDEETLWYTNEYYTDVSSGNFKTRIGKFKINDPLTAATVHFRLGGTIARQKESVTPLGPPTNRLYKDHPIFIDIDNAPSQPVNVSLVTAGGGTATVGVDYDLLNTSPITLSAGNLSHQLTLRVYDNELGEPDEFLELSYTLNVNAGNGAGGAYNQKHRITILGTTSCPNASAITVTRPTTFCEGDSVIFDASTGVGYTYVWKRNGTVIPGETQSRLIAKLTGVYIVEISRGGCTIPSSSVTVTANLGVPAPTTVSRTISFGTPITPGNGLQASSTCAGQQTSTYSGPTIGYDNGTKSGADPQTSIAGVGTNLGKVRVSITWRKRNGGTINDCGTVGGSGNPFNSEVSFKIVSPNNTTINLLNADTYADGGTPAGVVTTVFEDGGAAVGTVPASGTFAPAQSLSLVNGTDPNGIWKLLANDNGLADPLCVESFSVTVYTPGSGGASTITWWNSQTGGSQVGSGTEYIPGDTNPGTYTYYAEASCSVSGLVCQTSMRSPATLTITGACSTTPGSVTADATVCAGSNSGTLTLAGHTGGVVRWESSTDNFVSVITPIANTTTSLSYSNLTQTTKFRAVVQNGSCTAANSTPATITTVAASVGGAVTADATVCTGSNSGTLTLAGHTGSIVRWESSTDNFVSVITPIVNTSTSQSYSNLTQTTKFRAVVQNSPCAAVNSTPATITVTSASVGGAVTADATVCTGSNSGTLTLAGHTGSVVRWESSTDNFVSVITPIANTTTSQSYSNLTQTTKFRAVVQNSPCAATNSTPATITVTSASVGGAVTADASVCSGSNSGTLTLSGHAGSVVRWESSTDNFVSVITPIANTTTSQSYSNLTQTTKFRAVVQAGSCTPANSSPATITVVPGGASVGGSVTADASVCSGNNSGTLTLSGHTGSVVRWESSTDNFVSVITLIANTTTSQNYSNLTQTTKFRAVVQNGSCPSANSTPATITVTTVSATASNTGPYTVGQTIQLTATGGTSYSWSGPNSFTSSSNPATIPNATVAMSGIYTVTVTQSSCTATATTSVTVNDNAPCPKIVDYDYVQAGSPFVFKFPLVNNMVIAEVPQETSILVNPVCPLVAIESFRMQLQGPAPLNNIDVVESIYFYALFNNTGDMVLGRHFIPGSYALTITGYSLDDAQGTITYGPVVTNFTVVSNSSTIGTPTFSVVSLCAGSSFTVNFTATGTFDPSNQFQIQLSDQFGSFDNPVVIGTSAVAGSVTATIPANVVEGAGYKIRVASTNQTIAGNSNGTTLTLNPDSIVLVSPANDFSGGTTTKKATSTITATNKVFSPAAVNLQAGKSILLNAGFQANTNSTFKAEIKGCDN